MIVRGTYRGDFLSGLKPSTIQRSRHRDRCDATCDEDAPILEECRRRHENVLILGKCTQVLLHLLLHCLSESRSS